MRESIVEVCYRHSKHSLNSRVYVNNKIMTIRHVEMKILQETWIFFENGPLKKGSLHRTVVMG